MSTAKKFAGQTALYGLSTIAGRVLNFFLTPVYTRAYSTKVYGIFGNMYSYASMLNALLAFGMETTFFRYLNKKSGDKDVVYNNAFGAILAVSVVFLLITFPLSGLITGWIQIDPNTPFTEYVQYTRYFIGILVIDALCVIPFAKIRADGRPGHYGKIKLLNIIIFVGLNLAFIYVLPYVVSHNLPGTALITPWFKKGWLGYVFLSNLIASIATLLMLLPELAQLRPKFSRALFAEMLLYSWPVLIANFSFLINENLDKILLGKLLPVKESATQVGIYVACAKISIFLSIFVNAFRLGAEPFFFSHANNKNASQTYARIMNYFVIAVCLIFVALVANIDLLKYFIKGKDTTQTALYWSGLRVVPILLFGYVSLGIYMNLSVWYKLSDQTKYGLYISGVGAILTIVLNLIFIPDYGYMASAWISLTAYATMMILSYLWGQKNYPIPYNLKKNISYIIISVVFVYLSFCVFKRNIFAGNALLLLFVTGAYIAEGKELKAIFSKR
ncbi:lipopolysaccharide biosynthesis protein [Mucilaginibacter xinganensis]|uniref:Membrane protein involved in the export of O-antigen and teichoic acid n=1 Tax=Mucilaginibacter xinganensis TaxID=1234841 RepID=A0A223P1P7_9SPHI|nr:polysaccharide biosynthesis C-terminal domain-containing protein [Mucilaginibacter xinganensis]ASU36042.1 Membrane protein involved in the export of O-antigen and teichoic acid [Mucilaginibacter xinganensis]